MKMLPSWKWFSGIAIYFLLNFICTNCQTTSPTTTTMATNTQEMTSSTTTFVPTLTPLLTTEGTTLATADSALSTTTISTEGTTSESTTEGQASNEDLRASDFRGGYRFESTRNRPNANQEVQPETETESATTEKPEEKKIAWKFGRAGNNQAPWSSRPSANSGFSVWKKEVPTSNAGPAQQGNKNKQNDQGYLVWNVGQGNQQGGWAIGGNANGWAPAGWITADASGENIPEAGSWNAGGWSGEQSSENDGAQGGWPNDEVVANEGVAGGWDNTEEGAWNAPNQGAGGWENPQGQGPGPNSWQPQSNGNGGAWVANPQTSGGEEGGRGGGNTWVSPQQNNGWVVQTQGNANGWNNNQGSWNGASVPSATNAWQNGGPAVNDNGGWNNGQQNTGGWNNGGGGPSGWQDGGLSWKVYNEDTQTMENLDDNSGWKVIGDGGEDGWKLVDENGNVEWKIENINGEWKVTSADEFTNTNNTASSVPSDSVNITSDANDTTVETTTTIPSPSGGWDDDKQGRYIIWKFSDDGKGEARVYNGPGSEPEVWTVGDNQWWKETMGVKEADTVVQGGYNSDNSKWQGNGGWQNTAPQSNNAWQNGGNKAPAQNGNAGWQNNERPQNSGTGWRQNAPPGNGGAVWQNNGPPAQNSGNVWQTGGSQRGNKRWQNKAGPTAQQKWNTGVSSLPQNKRRQRLPSGWNAGNSRPPAANGWQNSRPALQPQGGTWQTNAGMQQTRWQNGGNQNSGGWANNGGTSGRKVKGRWRSNGNRPSGRWDSNNANSARKNGVPKGTVWNSGNGWQTAPAAQGKGSGRWANNLPTPNGALPPDTNPTGRSIQNRGNKASQGGAWTGNGGAGQTVPYIIIIKSPETGTIESASNTWGNENNAVPISRKSSNNNNSGNRRNSKYKTNSAGSGWQWNPEGGKDGWQWRDGWMGSGGGFGGWMSDKGTMYSNWRPTKINNAQTRKTPIQRNGNDTGNKKSASKMVFVFGTKRRKDNDNVTQPTSKGKKGKQVIIIDYTKGGKKPPKSDDGMKKDIESVIQALKSAKSTGARGTSWKQSG